VKLRSLILLLVLAFGSASSSRAQIGRGSYVANPAWSPDGSRIALIVGHTVEIRDASTSNLLHVLEGHTDFIPRVAWSPTGKMLATPSSDQTVKIWDITNGKLLHTLEGHNAWVSVVAWSTDETKLYSWGFDIRPNLFVWDMATGKLLEQHNSGDIQGAEVSPDGDKIALHTSLGLGVLDAQTLEVISGSPHVNCCTNQMRSMAWSPDSTRLVTGSINGLVTLWDADTATILRQFIANPHHQPDSRDVDDVTLSWVRDVTFSADGSTILSVSGDGTIREWQIDTSELVQETNISPLATARWSPYGGQLLVLELPQQTDRMSQDQPFDASEIPAIPRIIVPDASPERLHAIAEACGVTLPTESRADLTAQLDRLEIPPVCRADLLAVAAALESD
jgi:WD40 repeat protein